MFINRTHFYPNMASLVKAVAIVLCLMFSGGLNAFAQEDLMVGDPYALELFTEAKIHHDGDGVDVDLEKAHELYEQAAALGSLDARINLAYMYFVGQGVEQNYDIARHYYLLPANAGDSVAQKNLGAMYEHGLGVEANMKTAQRWYDKSENKAAPIAPPTKVVVVKKPVTTPPVLKKKLEPVKIKTAKASTESTTPPTLITPVTINPLENSSTAQTQNTTQVVTTLLTQNTGTTTAKTRLDASVRRRGPQWMSYGLAGFLLLVALVGLLWYVVQLRVIRRAQEHYIFATHFYARHRESLRGSYLRTPESRRVCFHPQDAWAVSVCALMVRFALRRHDDPAIHCKTSTIITRALQTSAFSARLETFALVPLVQARLFADIQHLNQDTIHPPKPFQFKYTNFLSRSKHKKLGNTRPAGLRLVK